MNRSLLAVLVVAAGALFVATSRSEDLKDPDELTGRMRTSVSGAAPASSDGAPLFSFAVSGDSRNCGDLVMPAIAKRVGGAKFFWHLGDFRAMFGVDEDIRDEYAVRGKPLPSIYEYFDKLAWADFIDSQVARFQVPVYLTPGNHETLYPTKHYPDPTPLDGITPKAAGDYMAAFGAYRPAGADNKDHAYYSWTVGPVLFIGLDNSHENDFDGEQIAWFDRVLDAALKDGAVRTIVAGMHEALPGSLSADHSMDQASSRENGEHVYARLLNAQNEGGKRVYVLASHSHFFMDGLFNNQAPARRLPGWIVGTGGAQRYKLPADAGMARTAITHVYGFMTGDVRSDGEIEFGFSQLSKADIKDEAGRRYSDSLVDFCFDKNSR